MSLGTLFLSRSRQPLLATSFIGLSSGSCSSRLGVRSFTHARALRATHYETLGIPQNATKSQIKTSFYNLSKKYHPDVNPETKDKFLAVNDAYVILNDDRSRRSYDRSLSSPASSTVGGDWSQDPSSFARRPGATHAWESPRRHRDRYEHTRHPHQHQRTSAYTHASPHARRATGGQGGYSHIPREDPDSPMSRLQRDSGFLRTVQVLGLMWVVLSLAGVSVHVGK